jgi:hypothetical protein
VLEAAIARADHRQLKAFVDRLKDPKRLEILFPNREKTLMILSEACKKKSQRFNELGDYCLPE